LAALETYLCDIAKSDAVASGAEGIRVRVEKDVYTANIEGREVFVEASVTAIASGRPSITV
jgi:hypothetical protein